MTFGKDKGFSGEQTGDEEVGIVFDWTDMSSVSLSFRAIKLP